MANGIDIKLSQDKYDVFDIVLENGDIAGDSGFTTTIYTSLFTDARADESQVVIPENRRGWIVNTVPIIPDHQLGGMLWLLEQRRLTQDTLNSAIEYARQSLQWLIDDEICININVSGVILPRQGIQLEITIEVQSGTTETHYVDIWRATNAD